MTSRGAAALKAAGSLSELVARSGISKSQLASYRSGAREPSQATRGRLRAAFGIDAGAWDLYDEPPAAGVEGSHEGSGADSVIGGLPTPYELARAAKSHRLALQARNASARDISAAINAERSVLQLVSGGAEQYNSLLTLTAATLKDHPEALEAWTAALSAAGL